LAVKQESVVPCVKKGYRGLNARNCSETQLVQDRNGIDDDISTVADNFD